MKSLRSLQVRHWDRRCAARTPLLAAALVWVAGTTAAQAVQFTRPTERAIDALLSGSPAVTGGFATGDLDGDGLPDLVVSEGTRFATWRQAPLGNFVRTTVVEFVTGQKPLLADFDGDGRLDALLAPAAPGAGGLQLFMGTATGWQANAIWPASLGPTVYGADVGDIDGDGDLDIVVSPMRYASTVPLVVLRNQGNWVFAVDTQAVPAVVPMETWPRLGDFDGDGDLDILAGIAGGGFVWLRNDGAAFSHRTALLPPMRYGHTFHCVADLDADGRPDVASAWQGNELDVLWGTATGFTHAPGLAAAPGMRTLVPVDLDGDGDLDLVAERPGVGIDVLRNLGGRAFRREPGITMATAAFGLGDLQGDGVPDLVFSIASDPRLVFATPRAVEWVADPALRRVTLASLRFDVSPIAGDFDGDGRTDMLLREPALVVCLANGDGTYRVLPHQTVPVAGQARAVDFDGDGDLDLVVAGLQGIEVLQNDGAGVFTAGPRLALAIDPGVLSLWDVGDLDGDGDLDLVVNTPTDVLIVRNRGTTFGSQRSLLRGARFAGHGVCLADIDGDGDLDLVTGIQAEIAVVDTGPAKEGPSRVYANDGTGTFTPLPPTSAFGADRFAAADFDGDGDTDIAYFTVAPFTHLLANDGQGNLTDVTEAVLGNQHAWTMAAADLDDDGDLDLIDGQGSQVLLNNGTGNFALAPIGRFVGATQPGRNDLAIDVDDDGDIDFVGSGLILNNLRQLGVVRAPHLGAAAEVVISSGPGFGAVGIAALVAAPALAAQAIAVPGLSGRLQIEPASSLLVGVVPTNQVGVVIATVTVPGAPELLGLPVWFQGVVVPSGGTAGFTNAAGETVLR